MKRCTLALVVASLLPSCTNDPEVTITTESPCDSMKQITIEFDIPGITHEAMTRGSLADAQMTDLWLFDFMGDELKQTIHQTSTDDGFGTVAVTADTGDHSFCFVASRGTDPTVSDGTVTWAKPSDTFWQSVALQVTPTTATSQSLELQRVATRLRVTVTDEVPATLKTLILTADTWHSGLNAKTGQPTTATSRTSTISVPANYAGTSGLLAATIFGVCGDDYTTGVTVRAEDVNGQAIASIALTDVPMHRNITTNYSGPLFSRQPSFTLTADDTWVDDLNLEW